MEPCTATVPEAYLKEKRVGWRGLQICRRARCMLGRMDAGIVVSGTMKAEEAEHRQRQYLCGVQSINTCAV